MNSFLGRLLAAVFAFGLAGCASLQQTDEVDVTLVDVKLVQASLLETTADLTLRFSNERPEPLQLTGASHRLYLNGTYVGRALSNAKLAVPQLGTTTQVVRIHFENLTLFRKFAELQQMPAIDYRLESRLMAEKSTGFGGALRTQSSGRLDLTGLREGLASGAFALPMATR